MRLLVTGASGFLGRHVVAAARGTTVIRATRASHAAGPDELALGPAPWTRETFARALGEAKPDVVLHCAGATHSPDARMCFDANAALAAELLGAIAELPAPPRTIVIGSAAEYGIVPAEAQPVRETRTCAPRTAYAVAKYAQCLLSFAAIRRGLPVLVARLFNPVGVGMPGDLALPSFARQVASATAHSVLRVGDLSARRDFLDVREAARLLLALAAMADWPWPVVNICSGRAYRLGDLMDGLVAARAMPVRLQTDPALLRPGDMPVLVGSTKRLRSVGLEPAAPDFSKLLPCLLAEARGLAERPPTPADPEQTPRRRSGPQASAQPCAGLT